MHDMRRWWIPALWMVVIVNILWWGCEKKEKNNPGTENAERRVDKEIRESPEEGYLAPGFTGLGAPWWRPGGGRFWRLPRLY